MTDKAKNRAFLRAIVANPADHLPKLVYADWLEENDREDRARYIRHTPHNHVGWWMHLNSKMWRECRRDGDVPFRHFPILHWRAQQVEVRIEHGFVVGVRCDLENWRHIGPKVVKCHPLVEVLIAGRRPVPQIVLDTIETRHAVGMVGWQGDGGSWGYAAIREMSIIPQEIFDRLPPGDTSPLGFRYFPDHRAAVSALSVACLAWAKDPVIHSERYSRPFGGGMS